MLKVLVRGPALSMSGYGEQARFLLSSIRNRQDIDLYLIDIPWGKSNNISVFDDSSNWIKELIAKTAMTHSQNPNHSYDVSIQITIPNEWENLATYNIGYTAGIEVDRVSPVWIQKGNEMNKIVTISQHSKEVYESTIYEVSKNEEVVEILQLHTPIEVVNYASRTPHSEIDLELDLETKFNFLTISQFGPRKNLHTLISSFVKHFHDNEDVGLVVKTHTINPSIMDKERTRFIFRGLLNNFPNRKCKIYLLHGELKEEELYNLYTHPKIQAYVTTTHGEGYGLPIFEAACAGMPVIAPDWSGQRDFLYGKTKERKRNKSGKVTIKEKIKPLFCKIPHDLKEVEDAAVWDGVIEKGSRWCYVSEGSTAASMEKVYKNFGVHKKRAKQLKNSILTNFSKEKMYKMMNDALFSEILSDQSSLVEEIREVAKKIENPKERVQFLKQQLLTIQSQKHKLEILKNMFNSDHCYVLSCGPTLLSNNANKLKEIIESHVTISIKQAFDIFGGFSDFHVYNCGNFKKYDYSDFKPIVLEASTAPYKLGECDLKFFIKERDFNNSVSSKKNLEDWTLEKENLLRPYGPGIMYEVIFYLIQHLGFSTLTTVGWDNTLIGKDPSKQHFYDMESSEFCKEDFIHENEVAKSVPIQTLEYENNLTTDCIIDWYEWLKGHGCDLKICSSINKAPSSIERVVI